MTRQLDSSPRRSATLTGAGPNPKVLGAQGMLPTDESSSLGPNRWLALERRPVTWTTPGVPQPVTGTLPLGRQGRGGRARDAASRILACGDVIALQTGDPVVAVAVLTLRPNVWYDGPFVLLDELYVAPEVRGRGLGSALLAAAEALTRQRGGERLEINVDGDDAGARRLCVRHARQQRAGRGPAAPLLLPGTGSRDFIAREA
jgi:GNAT superfamily N-acetyltransferase